MIYKLNAPQDFDCEVFLPASKSISNRLLIIHGLMKGGTVKNLAICDDTGVMLKAFSDKPDIIDIGAAGTAMRFLTAYFATLKGEVHIITGTKRMQKRPISILVDALRELGAQITYKGEKNYPPLVVKGEQLKGGQLSLPGNVSSQYISALLLIAPYLQGGLKLELTGNIVSRPYIDLTLNLMKKYGVNAIWDNDNTITVENKPYRIQNYLVENDWTASSYWYEIAALADKARFKIHGLSCKSYQGDSVLKDIFAPLGIETRGVESGILIEKKSQPRIKKWELDLTNQPDLAQTLAVTAAMLNIPFNFTGLHNLKLKETDRIAALINEMKKVGYSVKEKEEGSLCWDGERCTPTSEPIISTYEDHRMAMAFAPIAIKIPAIRIEHPEVVSKSYPQYWNALQEAGFDIQQQQ